MLNLITYIGGKHYMLKEIIKSLDYSKKSYIELFGGSAKVLLNKPPHKAETYNDLDSEIFNLWWVCKYKFDEFKKELEGLIDCEDLFYYYKNLKPSNEVEKAVRTFYLYNCSISGKGTHYGVYYTRRSALASKIDNIHKIFNRLRRVQICNKDFRHILEKIKNKEDIMLYADPPYYGAEKYYNCGFGKNEHEVLAEYLNNAKYSVMVSYYYFDGIEELYPPNKWKYLRFGKTKHSSLYKSKSEELLILNYDINVIY